jgi:acyl transferase domain-containing protein
MSQQSDRMEGIAVVGMSIRFPEEATTSEGFWDMIMQKRCASKPFPKDRINLKGIYHPDSTRHDTVSGKFHRQSKILRDEQ